MDVFLTVVIYYRWLYITGGCILQAVVYYRWLYITGISILQVIAWVTVHSLGHMWMFPLLWLYITGDRLGDSACLRPHVDVSLG